MKWIPLRSLLQCPLPIPIVRQGPVSPLRNLLMPLKFIAQTGVPFIAPRVAISRQIKHFCFVVCVILVVFVVVASRQIMLRNG